MARVDGPLFSLQASGSLADTITFSRWKGRPLVRQTVVPANPRSDSQVSNRAMMRFIAEAWRYLTTAEQLAWEELARADAISNFNAYTRSGMRRWQQFTPPTSEPEPPFSAPGSISAIAAYGGVRQAQLDINMATPVSGWGLLIFASMTTGFTPGKSNTRFVHRLDTSISGQTVVVTDLEPGTWYFRARPFSRSGNQGGDSVEVPATVT